MIVISLFRNRPVNKGDITPKVSFIITAYNEEKGIQAKIENTLLQDYPKENFEIIIASDCSTDQTDEIVKSYESKGVRLIRAPERRGKEGTQKLAVEASSGEILVFSDVATILDSNGVKNIVKNFNDPTVGCVSSTDRFIDPDGKIGGEGAYVRYEMFLRSLETKVNTVVGLSGSFFAARREVCWDWAVDMQSDFNTLMNSVKMGLRGILDSNSIGYYKNILDEKKEFERKIRTILRGISVFKKNIELLNPFKYHFFSWQIFSHKFDRWFVPFTLITLFLSNVFLAKYSFFYGTICILQAFFYGLACLGTLKPHLLKKPFIKIPNFFLMVNLAILISWYKFIFGKRVLFWTPSER